jgi:hypothetical protein
MNTNYVLHMSPWLYCKITIRPVVYELKLCVTTQRYVYVLTYMKLFY